LRNAISCHTEDAIANLKACIMRRSGAYHNSGNLTSKGFIVNLAKGYQDVPHVKTHCLYLNDYVI
jgi:hypothetical protein